MNASDQGRRTIRGGFPDLATPDLQVLITGIDAPGRPHAIDRPGHAPGPSGNMRDYQYGRHGPDPVPPLRTRVLQELENMHLYLPRGRPDHRPRGQPRSLPK